MILDITQMGPGISLWWALLSLAVGVALVALIVLRVWKENRQRRAQREKRQGEKNGGQDSEARKKDDSIDGDAGGDEL